LIVKDLEIISQGLATGDVTCAPQSFQPTVLSANKECRFTSHHSNTKTVFETSALPDFNEVINFVNGTVIQEFSFLAVKEVTGSHDTGKKVVSNSFFTHHAYSSESKRVKWHTLCFTILQQLQCWFYAYQQFSDDRLAGFYYTFAGMLESN